MDGGTLTRFSLSVPFILHIELKPSQNSLRGSSRRGRVCVQGLVTYYDANADTGGLCVVPGSHHFHDELCDRASSAKFKIDFVSVDADDPILRGGGVLVCAQAGGMGDAYPASFAARPCSCHCHCSNYPRSFSVICRFVVVG